jgi:hypothetical protein
MRNELTPATSGIMTIIGGPVTVGSTGSSSSGSSRLLRIYAALPAAPCSDSF